MASRLLPFRRAFAARSIPAQRSSLPAVGYSSFRSKSDTSNPNPQRDAQLDREKMDTQANEYAKSGTDTETASAAAFDPNSSNDPEEAGKEINAESDDNPMSTSPANPDVSAGTSEAEAGAGKKGSEGGGGRQGGGDSTGNK